MNKEVIKSWRQIYAILKEYGFDVLYEEDIKIIANFIKENLEKSNK